MAPADTIRYSKRVARVNIASKPLSYRNSEFIGVPVSDFYLKPVVNEGAMVSAT